MNMGFGLDLNARPQMELECTICKRPMNAHKSSCLQKRCADLEWERTMMLLRCPKCHKMALLPNRDDFLECTVCQSLFTRSQVAAGYDPDVLERTFILTDDEAIQVLVIPEKGKGDIPINQRLDALVKEREKAREKVLRELEESDGS